MANLLKIEIYNYPAIYPLAYKDTSEMDTRPVLLSDIPPKVISGIWQGVDYDIQVIDYNHYELSFIASENEANGLRNSIGANTIDITLSDGTKERVEIIEFSVENIDTSEFLKVSMKYRVLFEYISAAWVSKKIIENKFDYTIHTEITAPETITITRPNGTTKIYSTNLDMVLKSLIIEGDTVDVATKKTFSHRIKDAVDFRFYLSNADANLFKEDMIRAGTANNENTLATGPDFEVTASENAIPEVKPIGAVDLFECNVTIIYDSNTINHYT